MPRRIEITLEDRGVGCVADLLEDHAPRTCEVVWGALPQRGEVYHAKYARNEIYTLVPAFADPGTENPTITPVPGDVCYFALEPWQLTPASHGYGERPPAGEGGRVVDLAVFYGRNNLLLNPDFGFVPGNVFATITEGLEDIAAAAQDLWRRGAAGEHLAFRRWEHS